jgi:hypothetical protein
MNWLELTDTTRPAPDDYFDGVYWNLPDQFDYDWFVTHYTPITLP